MSIKMGKRQPHFMHEEELILIQLIDNYKHIIECKKSGSTSWNEKKKAWQNIEKEFNSHGRNIHRTADQLREKYGNLKKNSKRKFADEKLNVSKTGGGSYKPPEISEVDKTIYEIIGPQITGLTNLYDDDDAPSNLNVNTDAGRIIIDMLDNGDVEVTQGAAMNSIEYETIDDSIPKSLILDENLTDAEDINMVPSTSEGIEDKTWGCYTRKHLKEPLNDKLKVKKKPTRKVVTVSEKTQKKYVPISHELVEAKLTLVRKQSASFDEEHKLKMKILRRDLEIKRKKCDSMGITMDSE